VCRRPLSGGKGTIKQHQPTKSNPAGETSEEFYERLAGVIREDQPYYFMRWTVDVTKNDVARFEMECLQPILQELCECMRE